MKGNKLAALVGVLATVLLLGSFLPVAAVTMIDPGDVAIPVPQDNSYPTAGYTVVTQTLFIPYTSVGGNFSGLVNVAVVRENTGFLSFYYSFSNNSKTDSINHASVTSFAGFETWIGTTNYNGGLPPDVANRSLNGSVIDFEFPVNTIMNGAFSQYFYVVTHATNYTTGFLNLIDGDVARINAYAPAPLPASALLLGSGLLGLLAVGRHRK
jgi:hypothetical protein